MYFFRASEIHIKADQEIPWTLDGENGGFHEEADIENLRRYIQIVAPENLAVLDGDGGAEASDGIDIGLVHDAEEHTGVRGERFDVATLTLGVNRVEGEGGFA